MKCKKSKGEQEQCSSPQLEKELEDKRNEFINNDLSLKIVGVEMFSGSMQMDGVRKVKYSFEGFGGMLRFQCLCSKYLKDFDERERFSIEEIIKISKPFIVPDLPY